MGRTTNALCALIIAIGVGGVSRSANAARLVSVECNVTGGTFWASGRFVRFCDNLGSASSFDPSRLWMLVSRPVSPPAEVGFEEAKNALSSTSSRLASSATSRTSSTSTSSARSTMSSGRAGRTGSTPTLPCPDPNLAGRQPVGVQCRVPPLSRGKPDRSRAPRHDWCSALISTPDRWAHASKRASAASRSSGSKTSMPVSCSPSMCTTER